MAIPVETTHALIALFRREGYMRAEPPVLQPADVFLDLSGEDIRRRLFVTQDADGRELCLRPEYTIPICRHYLASGPAAGSVAFSYAGPVFRLRQGETGEFPQAGIESFGREDREAADAEIMSLALEALAALGLKAAAVTVGDMAILDRLVDQLGVDAATKRRLTRRITKGKGLPKLDSGPTDTAAGQDYSGLLSALDGQNPMAARGFVEDVLSVAGISRVGGRTAGEIAERFLTRSARRSRALGAEARAVLERYLALDGEPDSAAQALRALAADASLDLEAVIDSFETRTGFMATRGVDVSTLAFSASFARNLDYYTGFIFEMTHPRADGRPLVGGGRYDRLLAHLGAPAPVPAVGCAIWLGRFDAGPAEGPGQ